MFFKKKVKLSQDEKIALVKQFISSDITLKQLAKDNHVKEKELMLWYQAYRYGIELSINNEAKTDIIPLVSDDTALPEDTFIAFLNKDYSVNSKQFLPLLHSETDAIKFASGQGAVVAQGDETVLLDIREMVLSLCPELTENDLIIAQIKDINISEKITTKSVSDVSASFLTWFVSGALEMEGLDIDEMDSDEIEASIHEHLYNCVSHLENIGVSNIKLLKGDVFGEAPLKQCNVSSDSIDDNEIDGCVSDEAITFVIDINQDDWFTIKDVSESLRSDLSIMGKYDGGIYQQMFSQGELDEGVLNGDEDDVSETYYQILSNLKNDTHLDEENKKSHSGVVLNDNDKLISVLDNVINKIMERGLAVSLIGGDPSLSITYKEIDPYQDGEETLYGVLKIVLEDEDNCPDYIDDDEAENLCDWINGKMIEHQDEFDSKTLAILEDVGYVVQYKGHYFG